MDKLTPDSSLVDSSKEVAGPIQKREDISCDNSEDTMASEIVSDSDQKITEEQEEDDSPERFLIKKVRINKYRINQDDIFSA